MALSYKNDDKADERLSPTSDTARHLYNQEHDAIPDYDRANDGLDDHPVSGGDASGKSGDVNGGATKNIDDAKEKEEANNWNTNVTKGAGAKQKATFLSQFRKKGPLGAILGGTGLLGILASGFFGTALSPIAYFENVVDDLNDQLAAMDIRGTAVMRAKIPRADTAEAISGCSKLSIRCKFATLSEVQIDRLKWGGITVEGDRGGVLGDRVKPTAYILNDVSYSPAEFADALKNNTEVKKSYKSAMNMKYLGLSDKTYGTRVMKRFGISKRPPELKGTHAERATALMNKAGVGTVGEVTFTQVTNADGEERWTLDGDTSGKEYTAAEMDKMKKSLGKMAGAKPPSRLASNAVKAISVVGAVDLACSVKNMIGGAAVAAKLANSAELVRYAAPIASFSSQMKAGEISVENAQVLGEFFMKTDERKQIVDMQSSFVEKSDGTWGPVEGEVPMKDNPSYGKNAMDSPLYQLSSSGQLGGLGPANTQYSLGMGQNTVLQGFSNFASISDVLVNLGTDGAVCGVVQNWFVRGLGIVAGVALGIGSLGSSLAINGAIAGGLIAASMILESIINNALSGSVLSEDMESAPLERSAATWTGMSTMLSESAKARGMIPGSSEQVIAYNNLQADSKHDYSAIARENADIFDINNQYSFTGSLARSLLPYASSTHNIAAFSSNIFDLTTSSFASLLTQNTALAKTVDPARFEQCDDKGYAELEGPNGETIDPDVQCNLRYVMPAEDLNMDTLEVAKYMEDNGYVEPNTTTGLPAGYTPPTPEESQGLAMDMLKGVANQFYDSRDYGEGNGAEYGKFLDYCVYRVMPFGETYAENGAINGVDSRWLDGSKCLDTTDKKMSYFRIYTFDKTVEEAMGEIYVEEASAPPSNGDDDGTIASGNAILPEGTRQELIDRVFKLMDEGKIVATLGSTQAHKQDIQQNLKVETLQLLIAMVEQSGSGKIELNATGPITHGNDTTDHSRGYALDVNCYGYNSQGASRTTESCKKLYEWLMANNETLGLQQIIWTYPPDSGECIIQGRVTSCRNWGPGILAIHWHHIHIGVEK